MNLGRSHSPDFWGNVERADEHIASHPGDLFYNLFSHSGLDYYRNTLLILTSQPTFRHRAKKRFLELNQEEKDEFDVLAQDLRTSKIKVTKEAFYEFVENQLKSPEENKADIDESFGGYQKGNRRSNRRNVLTGTMTTNGHELKILAYSLTKPKPPSHPVPNTTQFKLKSILTELGNSTQVNDTFPQDRYIAIGIDPGTHNTTTATVLDSNTSHQTAINLSISQGSQTYSARQFMKELNRSKQRKKFTFASQRLGFNQLEQLITPATYQQVGQDQTASWGTFAASITTRVYSVVRVQSNL